MLEITVPYWWLLALAIENGHHSYVTWEEIIEAESEEMT